MAIPTKMKTSNELQGIEKRVSLQFVRYANCWEDADILCEALQPRSGKRALSVSSAGDNTLALLAAGAEVVAVDLSVPQLACLELRCAAFRQLDYHSVLAFLGVRPAPDRLAVYERLKQDLTSAARDFWNAHTQDVIDGVIHRGKLEAYFRLFRKFILPLIHSRATIQKLFQPKAAPDRRIFWDRTWNNRRWRLLSSLFFSRAVMARAGRDPEFFRFAEGTIADQILKRTEFAFTHLPTHDNPYLDYIATGNFAHALPRYLHEEHFDSIRAGLDRLSIVHGPVEAAITQFGSHSFDAFNLSDVFEYLDETAYQEVYRQLLGAANQGARFAYWNTFVDRACPAALSAYIQPREDLAAELFCRDKAFFYSAFHVDEVSNTVL